MKHVLTMSCLGTAMLGAPAMADLHEPIVADFEALETPFSNWQCVASYGIFASHAGLEWTCPEAPYFDYQAGVYIPNAVEYGYTYGVTSGEQAFLSPWESSVEVSLDGGGLWTMESVWVNAAWNNDLTINFTGLRDGVIVAEMDHVHAYATIVELISFGTAFVGIDTLIVDSWGGYDAGFEYTGTNYTNFTMDDFTYSIPAPGAVAVLAIAGLCTRRRRRAAH